MQISSRCFAVTGLSYSPPWYVNAGFIAGEHTTLIVDTGANRAAAATIHGYASAVRPSNQLQVVNTEKHFDHIGGNGFFRALGIDVWGHPAIARTAEEFQGEIEEFNAAIPCRVRRLRSEANAFYEGTEVTNPNRAIPAEKRFDLGGITVETFLTPGHTPTNLSVWAPEEGVLYTGDCLIHSYIPNLEAGGPPDWRQWLASLDRVEQLRPRTVVCGHGPIATGEDVPRILGQVREVLKTALQEGRAPTLR